MRSKFQEFRATAEKYGIVIPEKTKITKAQMDELVPQLNEDELFQTAKLLADKKLGNQTGFSWDDLPDTNSLWDYIYVGMSAKDLYQVVQDACDERMESSLD